MTKKAKLTIITLLLATICVPFAGCRKQQTPVEDPQTKGGTTTPTENKILEKGDPLEKLEPQTKKAADTTPAADSSIPTIQVMLETGKGDIVIELNAVKAPITVENFIRYVDEGFYNGTIFHRIIPNFMIQGGGMNPNLSEKPTHSPILNEASNGLKNLRGTISMARTGLPHSATSQFFINHNDNAALDYGSPQSRDGYAVFGIVVKGMDVVDAIVMAPTKNTGERSAPINPVQIKTATVISGR